MTHDATGGGKVMVLVCYYLQTIDDVASLVRSYEDALGVSFERIVAVDNSGSLSQADAASAGRIEVIAGTNTLWEFSGWIEGMDHAATGQAFETITLINDSFVRNWTITNASRPHIHAMYRAADRGRIAGWVDNFSLFSPPYFSARVNSRLVVCGHGRAAMLRNSIEAAIGSYKARIASGAPLFSPEEQAVLDRWVQSQGGRWSASVMESRSARIFIEHHIFDAVDRNDLALVPGGLIKRALYSVARRRYKERR